MAKKKKKSDDDVKIFTLNVSNGSFPELIDKPSIKKSKKSSKKRNHKYELENVRTDSVE